MAAANKYLPSPTDAYSKECVSEVLKRTLQENGNDVEVRGKADAKKYINQIIGVREVISQHDKTVRAIMDVIETFSLHQYGSMFMGRAVFSPRIKRHVVAACKIPMVLPAFPAKSINCVDKVLGTLPDLGEELALERLNDLCESIQRVYEPGAEVLIATDGACYNGMNKNATLRSIWLVTNFLRKTLQELQRIVCGSTGLNFGGWLSLNNTTASISYAL